MNGMPSYPARFVHLTAAWAYGVSQPIFTLIDGNPDLLLTHDLSRVEVALFAVLVAVVPPAVAIGYVWLAARLSPWVADRVYLVILGAFLVPLAARVVKLLGAGLVVALTAVLALAVAAVVLYSRARAVRLFLGYSIVLPLAGLAWFVYGLPPLTDDAEAAQVQISSPTPVVFVVLDELPASSLMTRAGELDTTRYPSFARLARDATWYPNATTVHEWTSDAVPAILTGRVGRVSTLPTVDNYPENLFTLLGGSYSLKVREYATQLCPEVSCPADGGSVVARGLDLFVDSFRLLVSRNLPQSLSEQIVVVNNDIELQDDTALSIAGYDELLEEIGAGPAGDATLVYEHLLLPHAPYWLLPSGRRYDFAEMDGWLPTEHWEDEPWLTLQGFQRHLLQVGYTDRMLGRLLDRLERTGLYDRSLVIVVGDHGASFRAAEGRRPVTAGNLADIANVPLFVKLPEQTRGRVDPRLARTVDLLPTVADVLGVDIPWDVDGTSLLSPAPAAREVLVDLRGGKVRRASLDELLRDRQVTLDRKAAAFGVGADSLYRIGTNRRLLGRAVAGLRPGTTDVRVRIDNAAALAQVRRASGYLPVRISGRVISGRIEPGTELAVAVNGRIEALTQVFGDDEQRFRALVPERALRDGANEVEVFLVRGRGAQASLVATG